MFGIFGPSNDAVEKLGELASKEDEQASEKLIKYRAVFFGKYPRLSKDVVANSASRLRFQHMRMFVKGDDDSKYPWMAV